MSWPPRIEQKALQTISIQGAHYQLVPIADDGPGAMQRSREQRSQLQRFDSPDLENVAEFEYAKLPPSRRRIRLLKLRSGTTFGHEIFCEIVDADYDDEFHIPTRPKVDHEKKDGADGAGADGPGGEGQPGGDQDKKNHGPGDCKLCRKPKEKKHDAGVEVTKEEKDAKKKMEMEKRYKEVKAREMKYEALSWCWGTDPPDYAIKIDKDGVTYKKRVTKALALALKYLRLPDRERILWVDAICINQDDDNEKNHQVQMMSRIYTRADKVAVWLGEDTDESITAIDFIKNEIIKLHDFDKICSDKKYSDKWRALMMLMQRDWFSRRWVVQEIALASKATIYCGPDEIPWTQFAVAVELFVEVESATHRLSEIMKRDEKFRHVSGWFEHISELGASQLVQATGKVFRAQRMQNRETDGREGKLLDAPKDDTAKSITVNGHAMTIDPLDRRSLLSLEYLVTTMFIFKATEPRDAVYALLAIARDAAPFAKSTTKEGDSSMLTASVMEGFLEEKPFTVDYSRSHSDVCRDFVEFAIKRKSQWDAVQSLDILCRPWALDAPSGGVSIRLAKQAEKDKEKKNDKKKQGGENKKKLRALLPERGEGEPWRILKKKYAGFHIVEVEEEDEKGQKGDLKKEKRWRWEYKYPQMKKEWWKDRTGALWEDDNRSIEEYYNRERVGAVDEDNPAGIPPWRNHPQGWEDVLWYFPLQDKGKTTGKPNDTTIQQANPKIQEHEKHAVDEIVPSWVTRASQAPFSLYYHPGVHVLKTGRANADTLVGQPQDGHRNYSAAQTNPVDLNKLRFRKRQKSGHYSLYIRGFKLAVVEKVLDASQGGNIPRSWLDMAGWTDYTREPPDNFWRTIVADRGKDNRNPPYYYATACQESVRRGGIASGRVNTADLINNERNSIVAEFCRRVQSVIWGRRLFMTSDGTLGLATNVEKGDHICILYGCTVPVILSENQLKASSKETIDDIIKRQNLDDAVEALRSCVQRLEKKLERKARYRKRMEECPGYQELLQEHQKEAIRKEKARYGGGLENDVEPRPEPRPESKPKPKPPAEPPVQGPPEPTIVDEGLKKTHSSGADSGDTGPDPGVQTPNTVEEGDSPPPSVSGKPREKVMGSSVLGSIRRAVTMPSRKGRPATRGGTQAARPEQPATESNSSKGKSLAVTRESSAESSGSKETKTNITNDEPKEIERNGEIGTPKKATTCRRRPAPNHNRSRSRDWARYIEEPTEDKQVFYTFKGETYIHGRMDGEALREKFWRGIKDTLFEIR
ncbi:hypothetical protein OQA88_12573 [Cercophora sp. LCS_1]